MTVYSKEANDKLRAAETEFEEKVQAAFENERKNDNGKRLLVKSENYARVIATNFYFKEPMWYSLEKFKDRDGVYVRDQGFKVYEKDWLKVLE